MFLGINVPRVKNGHSPQQQEKGFEPSSSVVRRYGTLWLHLWGMEIEARYQECPLDQYAIPIAWPGSCHRT